MRQYNDPGKHKRIPYNTIIKQRIELKIGLFSK